MQTVFLVREDLNILYVFLTKSYSVDQNKKNDIVQAMWHVWGRGEAHTGFWWGKVGKRPLGRLRHG